MGNCSAYSVSDVHLFRSAQGAYDARSTVRHGRTSMHALERLPLPGDSRAPRVLSWRRFWHALLRRVAGFGVEVLTARLTAGQELRLHEAAGWTVVCVSGAVWLTQEADARDIFLERGPSTAAVSLLSAPAATRCCRYAFLPGGGSAVARGARRT
jgi:hypothetical protein